MVEFIFGVVYIPLIPKDDTIELQYEEPYVDACGWTAKPLRDYGLVRDW